MRRKTLENANQTHESMAEAAQTNSATASSLVLDGRHGQSGWRLDAHRRWSSRTRRSLATVVAHVRLDEMASSKRTAQTELTGENSSSDDTSKLACVVTGAGRVGSPDAEQIKHGALGLKDSATAEGTDFEGGHGDRDLEGSAEAGVLLVTSNK